MHRVVVKGVASAGWLKLLGWEYRAVCSCGAVSNPFVRLSWKQAMEAGAIHLREMSRGGLNMAAINTEVAAWAKQLEREL